MFPTIHLIERRRLQRRKWGWDFFSIKSPRKWVEIKCHREGWSEEGCEKLDNYSTLNRADKGRNGWFGSKKSFEFGSSEISLIMSSLFLSSAIASLAPNPFSTFIPTFFFHHSYSSLSLSLSWRYRLVLAMIQCRRWKEDLSQTEHPHVRTIAVTQYYLIS